MNMTAGNVMKRMSISGDFRMVESSDGKWALLSKSDGASEWVTHGQYESDDKLNQILKDSSSIDFVMHLNYSKALPYEKLTAMRDLSEYLRKLFGYDTYEGSLSIQTDGFWSYTFTGNVVKPDADVYTIETTLLGITGVDMNPDAKEFIRSFLVNTGKLNVTAIKETGDHRVRITGMI